MREAELKQGRSHPELRERLEFQAVEVAGIGRTGYLSKGSCAKLNVLNVTELLGIFYHNKKKYCFRREERKKEKENCAKVGERSLKSALGVHPEP